MKKLAVLAVVVLLGAGVLADGGQIYAQCAGCHQVNGQGIPGAFPPLAGELPRIVAKGDAGRKYLIQVVLFGLQGPIVAQGKSFNGVMPPFAHLTDAEVAAVLNHVLTSWGNDKLPKGFKPFSAAEVKALRARKLTPQQVFADWKKLGLK